VYSIQIGWFHSNRPIFVVLEQKYKRYTDLISTWIWILVRVGRIPRRLSFFLLLDYQVV
jgi:hypothetical protein